MKPFLLLLLLGTFNVSIAEESRTECTMMKDLTMRNNPKLNLMDSRTKNRVKKNTVKSQ